jgi:parallel beta-helix repeat protein
MTILRTFSCLVSVCLVPLALVAGCSGDTGKTVNTVEGNAGSAGQAGAAGQAGGSQTSPLCAEIKGTCIAFEAGTTESTIQEKVNGNGDNTTFVFAEGTFAFSNTLGFNGKNIHVKGQGSDKTILNFGQQKAGAESILASGNNFLIENLTVKDSHVDGIKVNGATGVTFRGVRTEFTTDPPAERGAYGLYPVQCKNVLIEDSVAIGASDAGIYVGQSQNIIVRKSRAEGNVAGIEIENSFNADVTENVATNNSGGILVFDLPGLQQKGGNHVRVFKNEIKANNIDNFAKAGNIVGKVPSGTGVLIMANHDVEVFENTIENNKTINLGIVSYYVTQNPIDDKTYYAYPKSVYVHDNIFVGGGDMTDTKNTLGILLNANKAKFTGEVVPDIGYDGIIDADQPASEFPNNPMRICISNNTGATFANLDVEHLLANVSVDATPYTCTLPALPAITLPTP